MKHLFFFLLPLLVLAGCGGDDSNEEEQTNDPAVITDEAADRFAELESAQYELDLGGQQLPLGDLGNLNIKQVEGAIERPNRASAHVNVSFSGANVDLNLVAVGEDVYMSNIFSGELEPAPEGLAYNPSVLFDDESGIENVLRSMQDTEYLGTETVNDQTTDHLSGTVPGDAVSEITAGLIDQESVDIEYWVTEDSRDLVQVMIVDAASQEASNWTLLLTNHDEPVDIETPDAG